MEHVFWCIGHDLIIEDIQRGEGCRIFDSHENSYFDMESGVWTMPLGHSHPRIIRTIREQASNIIHTGYCYANKATEEAAEEVIDITGLTGGKCVFLTSGSEAVEFGVQAIKKISPKPLLMTMADSFLGSYGSSGSKKRDEWYLFDWTRCEECREDMCCDECQTLSSIPIDKIGGFVFEPGSSSGLVRFPPKKVIKSIVDKIRENQGFIQVNEVTTGIGRTGKWFGFMHYDIVPDIVSIGKGLGNGYPVSAVAISSSVVDKLVENHFHYSQSHQYDPLGCIVARDVIRTIKDEGLVERCRSRGENLMGSLLNICVRHPAVKQVRGRGLMIAIEFEGTDDSIAAFVYRKLLDKGFIVAKRPGLNVLRIDPPLIIDDNTVSQFLNTLDEILEQNIDC